MGTGRLESRVERLEKQNPARKKHRDLSGLTAKEMTEEELILVMRYYQTGKPIDLDFTAEDLTVLVRWELLFHSDERRAVPRSQCDGAESAEAELGLDFNDKELRRGIPEAELDAMIAEAKESLARCGGVIVEKRLFTLERIKALRKRTS